METMVQETFSCGVISQTETDAQSHTQMNEKQTQNGGIVSGKMNRIERIKSQCYYDLLKTTTQ